MMLHKSSKYNANLAHVYFWMKKNMKKSYWWLYHLIKANYIRAGFAVGLRI